MNKRKIVYIVLTALLLVASIPTNFSTSKIKGYYSGDAINYKGQTIFGSTNVNGFELFKLENNKIIRTAKLYSVNDQYTKTDSFTDALFNIENSKLFVYLIDGRYLYKYDISNLNKPQLIEKTKDNSWDWFLGLNKVSDYVVTVGTKGVKFWNTALVVVDSYDLKNDNSKNIQFTASGNFIFNIKDGNIEIYDRKQRSVVSKLPIQENEAHSRSLFNDSSTGFVYVADDAYLKALAFSGDVIEEYKHNSKLGYDVVGTSGKSYIYFSDGYKVIKMDKNSMTVADSVYTTNLGAPQGWAMGMKLLTDVQGDRLVVFNNSSIIVLDKDLNLIDGFVSKEEDKRPMEKIYLTLDKNRAAGGSTVSLRGGGYGLNEIIDIDFAGTKTSVSTDADGRFVKVLQVPVVKPIRTEIKTIGRNSTRNYNIAFDIE